MMITQAIRPNFSINKRSLAYFLMGAALLLAAWVLLTRHLTAAPPADPYADAVSSTSGQQEVNNPNNAVGAPDGQTTGLVGLNASITLDMGAGEEGTQNLTGYFGPVSTAVSVRVEFLDGNSNVLATRSSTLPVSLDTTTRVFNFDQGSDGGVYRYVRITSLVNAGLSVDAIQAADYVGSGTGSGGSTGTTGTTGSTGASGTSSSGGSSGSSGSTGGTGSTGTTGAAATPGEATSTDKDGDGMPDEWEITYGLNPNDASDAAGDSDEDCLNNLAEYRNGTDPTNKDDLKKLGLSASCTSEGEDFWLWLLFILLVAGGIVSFWKSIKHAKPGKLAKRSSKRRK